MSTMQREDTPTGMQPYHEALYLVYQPAHPQIDEYNDPITYGESLVDPSDDPLAFVEWQDSRAQAMVDAGSPLLEPAP